jgi:arsenate reductase
MSDTKIYIYNKCSTCRKATQFLEANNIAFNPIAIREQPPTLKELQFMLSQYEGNIRKLFNTSGQDYRNGNYKEKLTTMKDSEALAELAANGNLIKRPFLICKDMGRVGFKEVEWQQVT